MAQEDKQHLLPRSSPFVGCLRHAPQQALAGQLERLLQRRGGTVKALDQEEEQETGQEQKTSRSSSSQVQRRDDAQSESEMDTENAEKLPSSSPYVGFQRHAPPSPVLCFSAFARGPQLAPGFQLPGIQELPLAEEAEGPKLLPGGLPEEVWSSILCLVVEVPMMTCLSRVNRAFEKALQSEDTWRDRIVVVTPSCLAVFAPHLDRWLSAWNAARKLVLPRSTQLLREVTERAPHLEVELSWRFDRHLKGQGVEVLKHGQAVRRIEEEELVVLGDAALPRGPGRLPYLEVFLDECDGGIGDNLNDFGIGVTACDPEEIRELGSVADEVPRSWVVDFTQSMVLLSINNKEAAQGRQLSSLDLKQGSRVGLLVKAASLEVYIDGILRESLFPAPEEQVPTDAQLYPVLDLYGRTVQISKTDAEEPRPQ